MLCWCDLRARRVRSWWCSPEKRGHRLRADRTAPWGVGRSVTSSSRGRSGTGQKLGCLLLGAGSGSGCTPGCGSVRDHRGLVELGTASLRSSSPGSSRDRRHGRPSAPRSSVCPGVASGSTADVIRRLPHDRCCAAITNRSSLILIAVHPRRRSKAPWPGRCSGPQRQSPSVLTGPPEHITASVNSTSASARAVRHRGRGERREQ